MGPLTAQKLLPVASTALVPGMYVAELDRSWLHTPFPESGFLISTAEQVEQLRRLCRHVYVDPAQSEAGAFERTGDPGRMATRSASPSDPAAEALADVLKAVAGIVRGARRQGIVDTDLVGLCARRLVAELLRDADALHWCLRFDASGGFLYRRAAGTAAVAATLALRLGLDLDGLLAVASGGLLLDLGKIAVPVPILAKPGTLSGEEQHYVRRHVERGLALVAGRDFPARALEMIAAHHERVDGTGYPHRLARTRIPLFGRLAAIADAFDAMTLDRRYAAALSPHAALNRIGQARDEAFDAAMADELLHALGTWPVGTIVELEDGHVAVVWRQRPSEPDRPHLIVTHDERRLPLAEPLAGGRAARPILRALPPREVVIDARRLRPVLAAARPPG